MKMLVKSMPSSGNEKHGIPDTSSFCLVCFESINEENYVEFKVDENSPWYPAKFCSECIMEVQRSQFHAYIKEFQESDCAREQRELLARGPPVNICDSHAFPEAGTNEIHSLWQFSDKQIKSAKLEGSLVGKERTELWENMKKFALPDSTDNY